MDGLVVFLILVAIIGGVGIALGMLVAPRLDRLSRRYDEEAGDDERPPD
jgi:hypothetical protein